MKIGTHQGPIEAGARYGLKTPTADGLKDLIGIYYDEDGHVIAVEGYAGLAPEGADRLEFWTPGELDRAAEATALAAGITLIDEGGS